MARRTKAGGAKKRPTRYTDAHADDLALALRAHRKGRWREAIDLYRRRLVAQPACLDAVMNLGGACVLVGRAREATAAYERARALASGDARVHRDAGIGLASIGRLDDARAALEHAVALDDTLIGAHLVLARLCADVGDRAGAVQHAERAIALAPDDASSHLELHRALFDDRALAPCLEPARRAVALDPSFAMARLFLAGALALADRAGEVAEALGPPGVVDAGLVAALDLAIAARADGARVFASKHETLRFALGRCVLPGPACEFGVRHGVSTRLLARHLDGEVHAFDSFVGLPEPWQGRDAGAFTTDGELPDVPPNVTLHVGRFETTVPGFAAALPRPPRLVHVDSDLYASARTVLQALGPHLVPGCILVFDELIGNASWRDDEFRAFTEAAEGFGWRHRTLALSWITGQGVIEIVPA